MVVPVQRRAASGYTTDARTVPTLIRGHSLPLLHVCRWLPVYRPAAPPWPPPAHVSQAPSVPVLAFRRPLPEGADSANGASMASVCAAAATTAIYGARY